MNKWCSKTVEILNINLVDLKCDLGNLAKIIKLLKKKRDSWLHDCTNNELKKIDF